MPTVTVTSTGGQLVIQDPNPVNGIFSRTVPASGTNTFTCSWDVWFRIQDQLEAYVTAGLCTVAMTEVTPTGTDDTSGLNTTYDQPDWALLNTFRKDIGVLQATVGTITSPFLYKGDVAVNTDFPLIADVETGWFYHATADVTDDAGATYTNTNQDILAGEEIVWNGTTWTIVGEALTAPFQFKGNIAAAADFPPPAATLTTGVKDGYVYRCTVAVVDDDATKTNTTLTFKEGDVIVWYGSTWITLGNKVDFQVAVATPVVLAANDSINFVDTTTIAAPSAAALPAATAAMAGRKITIGDSSGSASTQNITITPDGTDTIDGVNAAVAINKDYYVLTLECIGVGAWLTVSQSAPVTSAATPAAVGVAAAGTSLVCSPDDHVHAHGDQLGGTLHADVVAGVSDGFMTAAMATSLAAIVDDHIFALASAVDIMTDESEKTGALTGDVAKHFVPTHLIIQVATVTGTPSTPGTINIGTTTDGAEIAAAVALTGLILAGDTRVIPLAATTLNILGNATLYINVESAEGAATVLTCDVWVKGRQV